MPDRTHLRRLSEVWADHPIYFLTACTDQRRPFLANPGVPARLIEAWCASPEINGWVVGRYVVMPDHVHFFAQPLPGGKPLSDFIRDWKRWTAREILRDTLQAPPVWQPEFFDHILRSAKSYEQKWDYVRENPKRAGLVACAEDWPYAGECRAFGFRA